MRILDLSSVLGIEDNMSLNRKNSTWMRSNSRKGYTACYPTGSGKTVPLYTGLNILNQPERNISTAEDPVEINLEGINQVQINKSRYDVRQRVKSVLRQIPMSSWSVRYEIRNS